MGCCGGSEGEGNHKPADGETSAGRINWVQIVALGLIVMLVLGFVIGR